MFGRAKKASMKRTRDLTSRGILTRLGIEIPQKLKDVEDEALLTQMLMAGAITATQREWIQHYQQLAAIDPTAALSVLSRWSEVAASAMDSVSRTIQNGSC